MNDEIGAGPVEAQSSSDDIGEKLIAAGWRQGCLLPALAHLVLFNPEINSQLRPRQRIKETLRQLPPSQTFPDTVSRHNINAKVTVLSISQDCDIARDGKT